MTDMNYKDSVWLDYTDMIYKDITGSCAEQSESHTNFEAQ